MSTTLSVPPSSLLTRTPTTTYPFSYTTYSTSLPQTSFSKPTIIPSALVPFSAAPSCAKNSQAPGSTPLPSNFPQLPPNGVEAGCAISNAREVNDHAFWDLYDCCDSKEISALGSPFPCTAQCKVKSGQGFEQLADCLRKRVEVVVCQPYYLERGNGSADAGGASASGSSAASTSAKGSASASGSARASGSGAVSQGVGSVVGVGNAGGAKVVGFVFGLMALGSAAGMFL